MIRIMHCELGADLRQSHESEMFYFDVSQTCSSLLLMCCFLRIKFSYMSLFFLKKKSVSFSCSFP